VVDANLVIRQFLLSQASVTSLLGTNQNGSIYCGYDLPEHFDPTLGPVIQIFRVGGHSHDEIKPMLDARMCIKVWVSPENALEGSQVYGAINDVLHGLCGQSEAAGTIVRALEVTGPLEMTDPETGWIAVYAFYQVLATTEVGPGVYTPQFYEGEGAPEALHNNTDVYYDESTGNLYEQVEGAWLLIGNIASSGGGELPSLTYHHVIAAGTNTANIKSVAGTVTGWEIFNDTEFPFYVKLFNKATAPVPGTDTPQQTIAVQAGEHSEAPPGAGITYSAGIGIAITANLADLDNTGVSASAGVVDIFYQ
jgi:hypothetical protein